MNPKQSSLTECTSLNAEALHEISRLQENILQTLRNELKKLKEPEVMGASNVSTPVHEIGEDMTPLPSLTGSAVSLLKPVRQYSPLSPQRGIIKKLKPTTIKKAVDNSQNNGIKYNYKLRDYPRPWAEPPQRRRTISEESLEVHVTTSHFSDMSDLELPYTMDTMESQYLTKTKETPSTNDEEQAVVQEEQDKGNPSAPKVERTESSEMWKKSIIFKSKLSKVLKYGINSKTNLVRTHSKAYRLQNQSPNAIVNQVLVNKSPAKSSLRNIQKTVVFPAPIPDSKKLKLKNLTVKQRSSKYGLPLQLYESSDETNNNYLQDEGADIEITSKAFCERLNETKKLCNLVYQKLMMSRSVQAISQQDETIQTDDIPGSFSSEFELGLFIATLTDELIDAACEITFSNDPRQGIKSNSQNYSPSKPSWTSGPTKRRGVNDSHIPVPTNGYRPTRSEVNRPEQMRPIRRYNKAKEEIKSPIKYKKPDEDSRYEHMSTRKLSYREHSLSRKYSRSYREGSIPSSIKRALISITSPNTQKDAPVPSIQSTLKALLTDASKNGDKRRNYQPSEPDSGEDVSIENTSIEDSFGSFEDNFGSFDTTLSKGSPEKEDQILKKLGRMEKHLSNRKHQQQLLSSLKSRRKKSATIKKKLWWLFDSEFLDSSQGSPSLSSLKSLLPGPEKPNTDFYSIGKDFSDSSGADVNNQIQQTYCSRSRHSILKQPHVRTSRKRNIKMSYHPPDFADLFPDAGTILAEASQFMPTMSTNPGRITSQRACWNNAAVVSNRLLTPVWPK